MNQNDNHTNDNSAQADAVRNKELKDMEDWRDEHGQPNFAFLKSLVADGGQAGLEKLKSIAEDMDVKYDAESSAEELIEKIILAAQSDPNTTS